MNATDIVEDFFKGLSPLIKQNTEKIKEDLLKKASAIDSNPNENQKINQMESLVGELKKIDALNSSLKKLFTGGNSGKE